ncbi:MAG: nickel pincer cofactor biosynthesis protein LarC [Eubacterium sp.]|nr:nickel pincer cofactor biosynthesis protein LarC [Eubacterium sp.]
MKTIYIDCGMGAAGDMLTAALYELLDEKEQKEFLQRINEAGIPEVEIKAEPSEKCGIFGTHMKVLVNGMEEEVSHHHHHEEEHHHHDEKEHEHHHHEHHHEEEHEHTHAHVHRGMKEIEDIFHGLQVSDRVKKDALSVYGLIAEAESHAHNRPVSEIHFHEVGTMDAIADVTAVCLLMEMLAPESVVASPIHVGSGHVHCAHGILPVPAPATAFILKDVPIYSGKIRGELCTPTGAALLKYFANRFDSMPMMKTERIGYGMGKKDFSQANCVRVFLGTMEEPAEKVLELSCNVDDMTGEQIGFAIEQLLEEGALEAYTISVGMKKSRPGIMICVLCKEEDREHMVEQIFKHTTTLGIRENLCKRYTLTRELKKKDTPLGEIRVKQSKGFGVTREKFEYEDLAEIARSRNSSLEEVMKKITE